MGRPTNSEVLQKVHERALAGFNRTWEGCQDERLLCQEDRRFAFVSGGQWEGDLSLQFENRPRMEINHALMAVTRLISEYRNNRITADFIPKDGATDLEMADICDGLYRADEQDSCAQEAYDNAFEEGSSGGMGAWRIRAELEDEDGPDDGPMRLRIEPIFDADTSVFFDADARRYDKADAKCCWVVYAQERHAYEQEWGDDPATWPKDDARALFDWSRPDVVYLAEYYEVEKVRETLHQFVDLQGEAHEFDEAALLIETEAEDVESAIGIMTLRGMAKVGETRKKRRRVHKYIMSGGKVLEDCGYIPGPNIPVIPFYGKRFYIDGVERMMGLVRPAKDPSRVVNMLVSRLSEIAALSAVRKPIFLPEQIARFDNIWAEDNIANRPYLVVDPITGTDGSKIPSGPVGYTEPPNVPEALAALITLANQYTAELLGRPQEGQEIVSNISGKAVDMIQQRLDLPAVLFMSNFAKSMRRSAEVWLGMAADGVYVERGRRLKAVGEQGNIETVELGEPTLDKEGKLIRKVDLTRAKFDVVADVGPSFMSRRDAMVRSLIGLMPTTQDPQDAKILHALILMNIEGEGLADVNEYYRKQLVAMGVVQPNDEERKAMEEAASQPQEPDPQAVFLQSEAEKNLAQAELDKARALEIAAKVDKTVAETEKVDADIADTLAAAQKKQAETAKLMGEQGEQGEEEDSDNAEG